MNYVQLAKIVTKSIVGIGTGTIVGSIVKNNVTTENLSAKITVPVASYVLGSMAAELACRYTDVKIDEAAEWLNANFKK